MGRAGRAGAGAAAAAEVRKAPPPKEKPKAPGARPRGGPRGRPSSGRWAQEVASLGPASWGALSSSGPEVELGPKIGSGASADVYEGACVVCVAAVAFCVRCGPRRVGRTMCNKYVQQPSGRTPTYTAVVSHSYAFA